MQTPTSATEQYRSQQARAALATNELTGIWRSRFGSSFEASWRTSGALLVAVLTEAQRKAAESAAAYVPDLLAETGQPQSSVRINPAAFAGVASDGRPLDSLVYQSVVATGTAYNAGATVPEALAVGERFLSLVATLQVQDAGRAATSTSLASNKRLFGYTRFLNPPSCQRCAVLAGRTYRYSRGFQRHPKCDCIMLPVQSSEWAKAEGFVMDPTEQLDSIRDLTKAQRQAIADGADLSQVVNAKRGMWSAAERLPRGAVDAQRRLYGAELTFTDTGTTSRALYGGREIARSGQRVVERTGRRQGYVADQTVSRAVAARPTPESIYRIARDRDDAIRLLKRFGYIF